jgi:phage gpG-like protein
MISGQLVNREGLVAHTESIGPETYAKVQTKVRRLTMETLRLAKQLAPHKTGRLQRSINAEFADEGGYRFTGTVGTNVVYARVQEYGGAVTIREHMRMMTQAFGRPVNNPREILVREHIANFPERSYLRAALEMMSGVIAQDFSKL